MIERNQQNKEFIRKIPELLAPAGGMEQLRAAVENGADAVYLGGRMFNARLKAGNFTDEELEAAVDYAHLRRVKIYIAMNTLIKDSEMARAMEQVHSLYQMGVDALILQSPGFAQLVASVFPDLDLHLSTQGTVHQLEGVKAAKAQGFSRVVLSREMTLEEIKTITGQHLAETEVFIHGALCFCYSGQCQMSRVIGGRSGNRGVCAQPCRLPYDLLTLDEKKDKAPQVLAQGQYLLSPKDLCGLGDIGRLAETGVDSLKIEGRMKSPEYVAVVTGIYRKYLDQYAESGEVMVEKKDEEALHQIFNRGGFTGGYLQGNPKAALMSVHLPKHQGIHIGTVEKAVPQQKIKEKGQTEKNMPGQRGKLLVRLEKKLALGDGVEVRNDQLSGNVVTWMQKNGQNVKEAGAGDLVGIGYLDGSFQRGDAVYKITDKQLMQQAKDSYEGKSSLAESQLKKTNIKLHLRAKLGEYPLLKAADNWGNEVVEQLDIQPEIAQVKALTEEAAEGQLRKTGGTPFRVIQCELVIDEGISLPVSKINELRRRTMEKLEERIKISGKRDEVAYHKFMGVQEQEACSIPHIPHIEQGGRGFYLFHPDQFAAKDVADGDRVYLPYHLIPQSWKENRLQIPHTPLVCIPVIPNTTKGWHDEYIRLHFEELLLLARWQGIMIGQWSWVAPFASAGVNVYGDYGLNLYNSQDFLLAHQWGIQEAVVSDELKPEEIEKINFHGVIPEVTIGGQVPLMVSEHLLSQDFPEAEKLMNGVNRAYIRDRKGVQYRIFQDEKAEKMLLLSDKHRADMELAGIFAENGIKRFRIYGK